jgi:DNA (cytosine-5)-methyltransferase 1
VAQKEGEKEMKVLSLFSGVGGFDLGLERAGMETVFQCEWDKHATSILERHWPDTPRWTDVSTLMGAYVLQHAPIIDVVAWGSPCQDLSVAGKRAGLGGERSGLFHEGIRIIKEIREITNGQYPRFSIWENVAGALSSSNGADFGEVLYEMDEAGACFSEWRLLDAQYFGVPQRRRRVFVISVFDSATAARCPDPLLPVCEGVRGDIETGGTEREEPARTVEQSLTVGGQWAAGSNENDILRQSISSKWSKGSSGPSGDEYINMVVGSLAARDYKGVGNQYVNEGKCVVETFTKAKRAQTSTDDETWVEGKPILEPILIDGRRVDDVRVYDPPVQTLQARMGTGGNNVPVIGFSHTQGLSAQPPETAWPTLRQGGAGQAVAIPIQDGRDIEKHQNGIGIGEEGAPSYTLDQTGAQAVAYGIQGNVIGRQDHNGPAGKGHTDEGDPMFTLTGTDIHAVVTSTPIDQTIFQPNVAIQYDGYNQKINDTDIAQTLRLGRDSSDFVAQPVDAAGFKPGASSNARSIGYEEGLSPSLEGGGGGNNRPAVLESTMAVRRLTPIECERLMGWPDGWTEGQADTHRYKQCGNGVASPVATWIGQQLINL